MVRLLSLLFTLTLVTGCQALVGIHDLPPDDEPSPDAAPSDAARPCESWTSSFFDPCAIGTPGAALVLDLPGPYIFDTDTGILTDPDDATMEVNTIEIAQGAGGMARVLFAESVTIEASATLRAVGSRSFILAALNDATIAGTVDVSSFRDATGVHQGAGADVFCPPAVPSDGAENPDPGAGGSGGAGGSAAEPGSDGGDSTKNTYTPGGSAAAIFQPTVIRGGCPGGSGIGKLNLSPTDIGAPGAGGGGVLIAACSYIEVAGRLSAGGAGGGRGPLWAGGGGGGSGGLIAIEAEQIDIRAGAQLYANGGGGGGGAAHDSPGTDGDNALLEAQVAAPGGSPGHDHAGPGGAGGFGVEPAGTVPAVEDSGGGGGGGVGYILVLGTPSIDPAAVLSPPLTAN